MELKKYVLKYNNYIIAVFKEKNIFKNINIFFMLQKYTKSMTEAHFDKVGLYNFSGINDFQYSRN